MHLLATEDADRGREEGGGKWEKMGIWAQFGEFQGIEHTLRGLGTICLNFAGREGRVVGGGTFWRLS